MSTGSAFERNPDWILSTKKWAECFLPQPGPEIHILAVTWNMKGKSCPGDISDILLKESPHHLYIVSVQECLRSIALSIFYASKRDWEEKVMRTLGEDYKLIISDSLGGTSLLLIAHVSLCHLISNPQVDTVATGFFNLIPNKGGIGISFMLAGKKVLAVGCHLTSGEGCAKQRNDDLNRIEKELQLGNGELIVSERFDCVILCGDLNYRILGSSEMVRYLISENERWILLKKDELMVEMSLGNAAVGFIEGEIGFQPTYKLKKNNFVKNRVPSWTDRILYKDKTNTLIQETYGSIITNSYSDHRPVFSQFTMQI